MKSFYDLLAEYGDSDYYPYHMPGHKRRLVGFLPEELVKADITEIEGFDNLHDAKGVILALEERAAKLYDSEETFYLVGGSTCGVLSAISASVSKGGRILMARNCHKSAYHGAYLRGLKISYLYPDLVEGFSIPEGIKASQVKEALEKEPDIEAVLIVSPTYEGRISEVQKIAKVVHEKGKILIVDEAHGAHLGLAKGFSDNSISAGADIVIHSVHKTLPALTQTALLHVNGNLVDREKLCRFLRIYQSSSPSYILMAGIDNAVRVMTSHGETLLGDLEKKYRKLLRDLQGCKVLQFIPPKKNKQDIGKLVISTKNAGITGKELSDILMKHYKLQLEMACGDYALAMFTVGDSDEGYLRMKAALLELDALLAGIKEENPGELKTFNAVTKVMKGKELIPLAQALEMDLELVKLENVAGRVAGDFINLYPPGTPIVVPGEEITDAVVEVINSYLENDFEVQGVKTIEKVHYVCCVKDKK